MKKHLAFFGTALIMMTVAACGSPSAGGSAHTAGSVSVESPGPGQNISPNAELPKPPCTPVAGGIPAAAKDFNCLNLTSVSGSDATGELAWLGSDPFTLVTLEQDGALRFSSKTPCNTLMSSVKVTETQFIVDPNMAMTMMGCQSPQSDYESWVAKFFSTPLDYALIKDTLVLSGEHGTVDFVISAPVRYS